MVITSEEAALVADFDLERLIVQIAKIKRRR